MRDTESWAQLTGSAHLSAAETTKQKKELRDATTKYLFQIVILLFI